MIDTFYHAATKGQGFVVARFDDVWLGFAAKLMNGSIDFIGAHGCRIVAAVFLYRAGELATVLQ